MELFIFDLGEVIVKIDFPHTFNAWARYSGKDSQKILRLFQDDEPFRRFERGQISTQEYHTHVNQLLGMELNYNEFLEGWNSLFLYVFPEVILALKKFKKGRRIVVLSNTNQPHVEVWSRLFPTVHDICDHLYLSNEIGLRKPDRECYEYVLEKEKLPADQCIFFDDKPENIEGAEAVGIKGVLVKSPQDILQTLEAF